MESSGRRLLGPLGWRLFAAFTLVGVGAVALLAVLAAVSVRSQAASLVAAQRVHARHDIAAALAAAYNKAGSWQKADLAGAQALADSTGVTMIILGVSGQPVTTITPVPPGNSIVLLTCPLRLRGWCGDGWLTRCCSRSSVC